MSATIIIWIVALFVVGIWIGKTTNWQKVNDWLKRQGEKHREWKAKAPERRAARMQKMREDIEMQKLKLEVQKQRAEVETIRSKIQQDKDKQFAKTMDNWKHNDPANLFGGKEGHNNKKYGKPPPLNL